MAADHGHSHPHREPDPTPYAVRRLVRAAVVAIGAATLVALVLLWPSGDRRGFADELGLSGERIAATVTAVELVPCSDAPDFDCVRIDVQFDDDERPPSSFELTVGGANPDISEGDDVLLFEDGRGGYTFADFQRSTPLALLVILFVAAVLVLGRLRGVGALAGVVGSIGVLTVFLLPAINEGSSPLAVSLVAASVVAFIALYMAHGISTRTSVALLGTLASLLITGVLALVFVAAANLTGLADDTVLALQATVGGFDVRGLLLAGIVIGSLGVLDDVTVTQVAAVWELRTANPAGSARDLYAAAVRIGRDHISSTVNTLVLAYAGASLPLLLLFTQAERSIGDIATSEIVAVEIIRALVGSLGLIASVPITTALAVAATTQAPLAHSSSSGEHE